MAQAEALIQTEVVMLSVPHRVLYLPFAHQGLMTPRCLTRERHCRPPRHWRHGAAFEQPQLEITPKLLMKGEKAGVQRTGCQTCWTQH
jgi:hypothetical protein